MTEPDYDLLIAGGGMVGSALACALGDADLKIGLLEGAPLDRIRPGLELDARVSAISHASQRIFAAVGAWDGIAAWRVSPFHDMHVWDATGFGQIHFDSVAIGEPLLGWIIENRVIQFALLERVRQLPAVELLCPATLDTAQALENGCWRVCLSDGREFTTRLLVGADGAQSRVRQLAGIETSGWSYDQTAIVANVRTAEPHQQTAWQRFLPTGPLAFLPLRDGRSSIVWSTTPQQSAELCALDAGEFLERLSAAFDHRLGRVTAVEERVRFPLRRLHAKRYIAERLALVGDAAHVIHPLAGQGVNLGLLDAAVLFDVIVETRAAQRDYGLISNLRRYERWRHGDNHAMQRAMDGIKGLFGASAVPLRVLRNTGLSAVDRWSPLKSVLARHAMGLAGDLPTLAIPGF